MGFPKTRVVVTTKVLEQLISSENSCIEIVKLERDMCTSPYHGNKISNAIKEQLNELIGRCLKELNGIVLGFKNIKILSDVGFIDDMGCSNFPILADFFVFKPVPGRVLPAVVTKKSKDHVGCLVYHAFNVSIPKPEEALSWEGKKVEVGQEISFRVIEVKLDSRIPYIKGEFIEKSQVNKRIKFEDCKEPILECDDIVPDGEDGIQPLDDEPVKKKKKRSRRSLENENEPEDVIIGENEPKAKRRKKNKVSSDVLD